MAATIYYDGDCPFCKRYTALLRLRDAIGQVHLVDVRQDPEQARAFRDIGVDLDQGMLFEHEGKRYFGAEAISRMALLSSHVGPFNKANAVIFRSPVLTKLFYPFMRAVRGGALFALNRSRIHANDPSVLSAFAIFAHAFGMYAVADLLYDIYAGRTDLSNLVSGALGAYLLTRPRSARAFVVLVVCMLVQAVQEMPTPSNHAILVTATLLAISVAGAFTWMTGRPWTSFQSSFAPVGRCLLLTMYFFGVFHKINTGFLDPNLSCAVELWKAMPYPLAELDTSWWRQVMIYGTLIGEAVMFIGLLLHRTRHAAIMLGIAFHSLLSLSGYGFYLAFSTLTIALHLLFLSPGAAARITKAPSWKVLQARTHRITGLLGCGAWLGALIALSYIGHFTEIALLWLPWPIWLICLVGRHGRERRSETTVGRPLRAKPWILNAISIAFVANCFLPYLGLKNAQAMNMFANLTMSDGRSNHLLLPNTKPFGYLADSVKLVAVNGVAVEPNERQGHFMTYYALLDRMDREPTSSFSFERQGRIFENQSRSTLSNDLTQLHPRWLRAWFHFRSFNGHDKQVCEAGY